MMSAKWSIPVCLVCFSSRLLVILTARQTYNSLQPANILLLPSGVDEVFKRVLSEEPATIYDFPKAIPLKQLPALLILSTPL